MENRQSASRLTVGMAVAAAVLLSVTAAKADIMTVKFSGTWGPGNYLGDPNGNINDLSGYSFTGSESWDTNTDTGVATATFNSPIVGPFTIAGALGYYDYPLFISAIDSVPGQFTAGTAEPEKAVQWTPGSVDLSAPGIFPTLTNVYDWSLTLYGPNLGNNDFPDKAELAGLTGLSFNFDNLSDSSAPANTSNVTIDSISVPEPASLAVLGSAILGLGAARRRRQNSA